MITQPKHEGSDQSAWDRKQDYEECDHCVEDSVCQADTLTKQYPKSISQPRSIFVAGMTVEAAVLRGGRGCLWTLPGFAVDNKSRFAYSAGMKHLLLAALGLFFASFALAADSKGTPGEVAQAFMDSYIADANRGGKSDPEKLIQNSPYVTKGLKKAHAKVFKQEVVDADPILNAQDFPDKGFKVTKVKIEGEKAQITYAAREEGWDQTIKAQMVLVKGQWLIAHIGSL